MRTFWKRFTALFSKRRLEAELDEEVETHIAMLAEELRRHGMEARAARQAARREFGGIDPMKEAYRDGRGIPRIEILAKDVHYAVRGLRRSPAFTIAAVFSLALGIGANTAIFSFLDTLMLRMLPVEKPEQLLSLYRTGGWGRGFASYPQYLEFRRHTELFNGVLARSGAYKVRFDAGHNNRAAFVAREFVSGNYFEVLGVKPALGRLFTAADDRIPQGHPIVILSYDFWRSRFGLDPGVLGRVLMVDEQPLTVIGVAAPGFHGVEVEHRTDVWAPTMMFRGAILQDGMHWVWILARRRPEISKARIQAAANTIMQQHLASVYGGQPDSAFRRWAMEQKMEARDGGLGISMLREEFGKPLTMLMAAVSLVLLIACANVASLLLARGAARRREIALRLSLGATRRRIVGQWLIDSLLLALLGSGLGLLFAAWGERYMLLFLPPGLSDSFSVAPNAAVLGFTACISIISVLVFGLAPALRATALDPAISLKGGGPQAAPGRSRIGFRKALVVAQVAFSVVLAVLAGLFAHSLAGLRSINPGFTYQNVMTFTLDYPRAWKDADKDRFRERLQARLAALPGIVSFSCSALPPYQGGMWSAGIRVPGSARTSTEGVEVAVQGVGPDYFGTLGSRPLRGREFDESDMRGTRKVAMVNEAFVSEFWPGSTDPIGRTFNFDDAKPGGGQAAYIVGLAPNILHKGLKAAAEPTVYAPFHQGQVGFDPTWLVRAQLAPDTVLRMVRREINGLNTEVALAEPRTIRQRVDDSIFADRMIATLSGFFGGLALLLAAVGVYGVMAYGVARRTAELGLRMALGAGPAKIGWMVLRDGLVLIAAGLAIGLPLAVAAGRISSSLLYGIRPGDPLALALTVALLLVIGMVSVFVPARRASSIEPVEALRHE